MERLTALERELLEICSNSGEPTTLLHEKLLENSPGLVRLDETLRRLTERGLLTTCRAVYGGPPRKDGRSVYEDDWWDTTVRGRKVIGVQAIELLPNRTEVQAGEVISFALVNHGPRRMSLPHGYRLERSEGHGWLEVTTDDVAIPGDAANLPPGKTWDLSAPLPDDAITGRYRMSVVAESHPWMWTLAFEFSVS